MFNSTAKRVHMQVTIQRRNYIPENTQQHERNRRWEILIMQGQTVLDGTIAPKNRVKYCEKFIKELCLERGWEIVN